ncbi:hypothetical protein BSKO_07609 [Bryopsis sp. KO-2023]|nr:hypothetical protein BSKO_07609 [Bryopsis sp. KO-2023]
MEIDEILGTIEKTCSRSARVQIQFSNIDGGNDPHIDALMQAVSAGQIAAGGWEAEIPLPLPEEESFGMFTIPVNLKPYSQDLCVAFNGTTCTMSRLCTLANIPDIAEITTAHSMFNNGIISKQRHASMVEELQKNATEFCVPKEFADCAENALPQGTQCPDFCPYVSLPITDWRPLCDGNADTCCKYGTNLETCSEAQLEDGYCVWSEEDRVCSLANMECNGETARVTELHGQCQTTGFCADLANMRSQNNTAMCAKDGSGPGLDMCSGADDQSQECFFCKLSVDTLMRQVELETTVSTQCNQESDVPGVCQEQARIIAHHDSFCKANEKPFKSALFSYSSETRKNATAACLDHGGNMTALVLLNNVAELCFWAVSTHHPLMDLVYEPEDEICFKSEGCSTIASCNLQSDCVFVLEKAENGTETTCERVGVAILTYGLEYVKNATNAAYAIGGCSLECGEGCQRCDESIQDISVLVAGVEGTDLSAAEAVETSCKNLPDVLPQSRKGRCLSKSRAKCTEARSEKTCGEFECVYSSYCRHHTNAEFCDSIGMESESEMGATCRAQQTCSSSLSDLVSPTPLEACGTKEINMCPGDLCDACVAKIKQLQTRAPEDSICPLSGEISQEHACIGTLVELELLQASCGDLKAFFNSLLNSSYVDACSQRGTIEEESGDCASASRMIHGLLQSGHFANSTQGVAEICLGVDGDMADLDKIDSKYGHLYCDPRGNQCCESIGDDQTGITPAESTCVDKGYCEYESQCFLEQDGCTEAFEKSHLLYGLGVCPTSCTFVPSLEPAARLTSCTVEKGKDFRCNGDDDVCCVWSTSETFTLSQEKECSAKGESCGVHKNCVRMLDPCNTKQQQWDCINDNRCEWTPYKDKYNPVSGKCSSVDDVCRDLSQSLCSDFTLDGEKVCALVDRCETSCSTNDPCCGLDAETCGDTKGCLVKDQCSPRQDYCRFFDDAKTCATRDTCMWEEEVQQCSTRGSECAASLSPFECNVQTLNERPLCRVEATCVDECAPCGQCIDFMTKAAIDIRNETDAGVIARAITTACDMAGFGLLQCKALEEDILFSNQGSLGKRPAAICTKLSQCTSECKIGVEGSKAALDLCTANGLSTGNAVVSGTSSEGLCNSNAECNSEFCSFKDPASVCSCDPETGNDKCKPAGSCEPFCDQYATQIQSFNSRYDICATLDDCAAGFTCQTTNQCLEMSCSEATGLKVGTCSGFCVPAERTIIAAKFSEKGDEIEVELNSPAKPVKLACSEIFATDTVKLLGPAYCSAHGKKLIISMTGNVTINVADEITILGGQTKLSDVLGVPFTGSGTVEGCISCTPKAKVVYPRTISQGCPGSEEAVTFDGTYSVGTGGRALGYSWHLDPSDCFRSSTQGSFGSFSGCQHLTDAINGQRNNGMIKVEASTVSALAAGDYKFFFTATNFLAKNTTIEVIITKAPNPVPVVGIPGGSDLRFFPSRGIKVEAYAFANFVCDGYTMEYLWTSITNWTALPSEGFKRKDLILSAPVPALPENDYGLLLTAYLKDENGTTLGTTSTKVTLSAQGSPLIARIDGPYGNVVVENEICLDASGSFDPEDPQGIRPIAVEWICSLEAVGGKPCFSGKEQPVVEGGRLCVPRSLLTVGSRYVYTAQISKVDAGQAGSVTRSASATTTFVPLAPDSVIPTGAAKLLCGSEKCPSLLSPGEDVNLMVVVDPEHVNSTSIEWACDGIDNLEEAAWWGTNSTILVIKPNTFEGGTEAKCTAFLSSTETTTKGEAEILFKMSAPPICVSATQECLLVAQTSASSKYPEAVFTARVQDVTSTDSDVTFIFGEIVDDVFVTYKKGSETQYEFEGLEEGEHTIVVQCHDWYGSSIELKKNITIEAPEENFTIGESAFASAKAGAELGQRCQDPIKVLTAARRGVALLKRAESGSTLNETEGKTLAKSFATAAMSQVPTNVDEVDPDSFLVSLGVFSDISQSGYAEADLVEDIIDAATTGLTAMEINDKPCPGDECGLNVLNIIASTINKRKGRNGRNPNRFYAKFKKAVRKSTKLACGGMRPGSPIQTVSSSADVDAITTACGRERLRGLDGGKMRAGHRKSQKIRRGLKAFLTEQPLVAFPPNFSSACGEFCENDETNILLEFYKDTSAHSGVIGQPISNPDASEVEIVSGILDIQLPDHKGGNQLCPTDACGPMVVSIPVDTAKFETDKETVCLGIEDGRLVGENGNGGFSFVEYDPSAGIAVCNSTRLGEVFVTQFRLPPPAASPPPPPNALGVRRPPPPGAIASGPPPPVTARNNFILKSVKATLTFNRKYDIFKNDVHLLPELKKKIVDYIGSSEDYVRVFNLRPGDRDGISIDIEVDFPFSVPDEEILQFGWILQTQPEAILGLTFLDVYGVPVVKFSSKGATEPSPKPKTGAIVGGVFGALAFLVIVTVVAVWVIRRYKKKVREDLHEKQPFNMV